MAIDLITGKRGMPHVTPEQDAMWHKGMFGSNEDYVFNVYEKFRAEKRNNNTVRIHSGIGSLQGRFFCIGKNAYEDVTIDNGAQGMKRYDAICVVITKTEGLGLHMIELKVIKGTPSASNPAYPQIPQYDLDDASVAYMLLYYVLIEDTTLLASMFREFKLFDETPYNRALGFKDLTDDVLEFARTLRTAGVYPIRTKANDADVPSADYQGAIGYAMIDIGRGALKVVLISKTTGVEISNIYDGTLFVWRGWTPTVTYTSGTDTGWNYKKYSDGSFEAWASWSITASVNTTKGSMYSSAEISLSLPSFMTSMGSISIETNDAVWASMTSFGTGAIPAKFMLWAAQSKASASRPVKAHLTGRWD